MEKSGPMDPIIFQIDDNAVSLKKFEEDLRANGSEKVQDVILNYPTVYIHNWRNTNDYEVYVGESNHVVQRTKQHYREACDARNWQFQLERKDARLFLIGHEHFNKSLTLDIENRLIHYMLGIDKVKAVHNHKMNPQDKYYTVNELDSIFHRIWTKLRRQDPVLFPTETEVRDSAIFKASPLHKLTPDQARAKELIIQKAVAAMQGNRSGQLIFIQGEAGTGKTVLNSSTFYDLVTKAEDLGRKDMQCYMLVNHDEQMLVYKQIADKLCLTERFGNMVCKPTTFINHHTAEAPVDVAFVDEAHLLLTQGKQSYRGKNQLEDIIERSRVTVVMFDENQILTAEQYWEAERLELFKALARQNDNYIELKDQLRMSADQETIDWIDAFTKYRRLGKIPNDRSGYEIRIFDGPEELEREIKRRASSKDSELSRMIATYDWEYNGKKSRDDRLRRYWEVMIDRWHKPWNYQLKKELNRREKKNIKTLSWAEQPQTIDEVGSTFTIQGFDLNYAGVILGPSVKYRNGKIVFDPKASCNDKATQNRTLSDGTKRKFGDVLIQHEVRVLMTRGVKGLYIYACDEELRKALREASAE